jgi:hypothetical protein
MEVYSNNRTLHSTVQLALHHLHRTQVHVWSELLCVRATVHIITKSTDDQSCSMGFYCCTLARLWPMARAANRSSRTPGPRIDPPARPIIEQRVQMIERKEKNTNQRYII